MSIPAPSLKEGGGNGIGEGGGRWELGLKTQKFRVPISLLWVCGLGADLPTNK